MNDISKRFTGYFYALLDALPRLAMGMLIFVLGILIANWLT
ncbi:hypothetical protein [Pseudocnuella soli]|nr:hypothetical protein [Pseudocnuella soli]